MKFLISLPFLFLLLWLFPSSTFSLENEVVFKLKKERAKANENKKERPHSFKVQTRVFFL